MAVWYVNGVYMHGHADALDTAEKHARQGNTARVTRYDPDGTTITGHVYPDGEGSLYLDCLPIPPDQPDPNDEGAAMRTAMRTKKQEREADRRMRQHLAWAHDRIKAAAEKSSLAEMRARDLIAAAEHVSAAHILDDGTLSSFSYAQISISDANAALVRGEDPSADIQTAKSAVTVLRRGVGDHFESASQRRQT